MCVQLLNHGTLCGPMDCSIPGSSIRRIFQARILECVAISYSRESSQPRNQTHLSWVSCIGRWILYYWTIWKAQALTHTLPKAHCLVSVPSPHSSILLFITAFYFQVSKSISFLLLCKKKYPKSQQVKTTNIYYLSIFVGQEFMNNIAGRFLAQNVLWG